MIQTILKYTEIVTDLKYVNISTVPLELCALVENKNKNKTTFGSNLTIHYVEDSTFVGCVSEHMRITKTNFPLWISSAANEILNFYGVQASKLLVDLVVAYLTNASCWL